MAEYLDSTDNLIKAGAGLIRDRLLINGSDFISVVSSDRRPNTLELWSAGFWMIGNTVSMETVGEISEIGANLLLPEVALITSEELQGQISIIDNNLRSSFFRSPDSLEERVHMLHEPAVRSVIAEYVLQNRSDLVIRLLSGLADTIDKVSKA